MTPLLLDTSGAATLLNLPESWIATAVRRGEIPSVRLGHHVRFKRSDLEKFIDEQREGVEVSAVRRRTKKADDCEGLKGRLGGSNDLLAVCGGQLPQQKGLIG